MEKNTSDRWVIKGLCFVIKQYQYWISPSFSHVCRFYPSCSQYMIDALKVKGLMQGLYLGVKRIFKCHPWHQGGNDPVV